MALLFTITEGWTKELGPFTLRVNGQPLDLTDTTVQLFIRPKSSNTAFIETTGDVRIDSDQAGAGKGKVYFKPDAADFRWTKSPYEVHWKVTDVAGDDIFIPHGDPDTVKVAKV